MSTLRVLRGSRKNRLVKPVLILGNFDGVHLAHQAMFQVAVGLAQKLKSETCVYTFDPHPAKILVPEKAPRLLATATQKIEQIASSQIDTLLLEPFTKAFADLSADAFLEDILFARLNPAAIVVGFNFTFGKSRSGTIHILKTFCKKHQIILKVFRAFRLRSTVVSSSAIRRCLLQGRVDRAAELLGRNFEVVGKVMKGRGVGRTIGFPTANLRVENETLPQNGVYAVRLQLEEDLKRDLKRGQKLGKKTQTFLGVANLGVRPTFGLKKLSFEVHLFDFSGDLYGKIVRVSFVKRLRKEKTFTSSAALIRQIQKDVELARGLVSPTV